MDCLQETLQANTAKQLGPTANAATLHCDILVLGCDELYILDTVPDELRGDLEQVLSALHDAVGKHSGVLGALPSPRMHLHVGLICYFWVHLSCVNAV